LNQRVNSSAENWTAKRQLYRYLKANPTAAPTGSVYASFLSSQANTTIGRFEDQQTATNALLAGDASQRSQLAGHVSSLRTKFDELKVTMDALATQPNNTALLAQRSAKQAEITTVAGQAQGVENTMLAAGMAAASQLLTINAAISVSPVFETNQKTANRVLLETIAYNQTELTSQQVADLMPIANQCPLEGGEGVYLARALLGNEIVYDDFTACGMGNGGQFIKSTDVPTATGISFKIYPNPASGWAIIELKEALRADGKLVISNMQGIQLHRESLLKDTQAVPVDLSAYTGGVYFVTLTTADLTSTQLITIGK
jgi:hypothetical protein